MSFLPVRGEIYVTNIEGRIIKYSDYSNSYADIRVKTKIRSNDILTTDPKGLAVLDFNDEVIGTVVLAPNTQVILRQSKIDGIRLLTLVRGHLRLYRDIRFKNKKVGVLINIRDNPTAYYGTNFEVQYYKHNKKITSFNKEFKTYKLATKKLSKRAHIPSKKTDNLYQDLEDEIDELFESTNN